jgi:hypothetical protein
MAGTPTSLLFLKGLEREFEGGPFLKRSSLFIKLTIN